MGLVKNTILNFVDPLRIIRSTNVVLENGGPLETLKYGGPFGYWTLTGVSKEPTYFGQMFNEYVTKDLSGVFDELTPQIGKPKPSSNPNNPGQTGCYA